MVLVRSYSLISGSTSDDTDTNRSGNFRRTTSASCDSWSKLRYELSRQIAIASMPSSAMRSKPASADAISNGVTTTPSASMRSETSRRYRRRTSGGGGVYSSENNSGMRSRLNSSTSRNPAVVIRAVRAPLFSRITFVAIVVP